MATSLAGGYPEKIEKFVSQKRLRNAFQQLRAYAAKLGDWRVTERIDKVEESYSMMLRYAGLGAFDPGRDEMLESIIKNIYDITDKITRELSKPASPAIYFSTVRYEDLQGDSKLTILADRYRQILSNVSIYNLAMGRNQAADRMKAEKEELERRLFNLIWISFPLKGDDADALRSLFVAEDVSDDFKAMMISALLLSETHFYDEEKLMILLDWYQNAGSQALAVKALCAVLMSMYLHRNRLPQAKLKRRIDALRDVTSWHSDVKMIFLQFIRTRDTERINRKMQDELLPDMMKLRPDITERLKEMGQIDDPMALEENPEWQELLEQSGITDKIKELSKMQEDGGDVFMSTFASLKQFPFFSAVANWFVPFSLDHTEVVQSLGTELSVIGNMVKSSSFLCDGDKFSFVLALASVPAMQKKMMLSQFDAQNINELELRSSELGLDAPKRDNIANKYVQDIYRFFKLYRRRGDFNDPFMQPLNLLQVKCLSDDLTDMDTLSLVSEFYFKHEYYDDAYHVFKMLAGKVLPSVELAQKLGYCCQKMGNIEEALEYYEQAELLNAEKLWTLRRIAACNIMLGRIETALEYYKRIELKKPDDLNVALNIGNCYLELNRPVDALRYYFKVEFLDEKSTRALRPIAWASFISGDYDQSQRYFEKVLLDSPSATDYMNIGHLSLVKGNVKEAINYYSLSIGANNNDIENFIKNFNNDVKYLCKGGVDESLPPLIVDTLLYSHQS